MARVAHIIQRLAPGGIESLAVAMLTRPRAKDTLHLIGLEPPSDRIFEEWQVLNSVRDRIHCVEKEQRKDLGAIFRLKRLFQKLSLDAVHIHHIGPLIYGGLAARLAKVPLLIHSEHDAWHLEGAQDRYVQYALYRFLKPIVVADAFLVGNQLKRYYPFVDPQIIHNGVDTEKFVPGNKARARAILGLSPESIWVGCAARLSGEKGQRYLIDALCFLPDNVCLVLAGEGAARTEYQQQAADLGLLDRIKWLGFCNDMPSFYQALDLFCLPSLEEGLPLVLLEAQACNISVVATDVGASKEAVCEKSACLVPAKNSSVLASAILDRIGKKEASTPRDFVIKERSYERMIQAFGELYDR